MSKELKRILAGLQPKGKAPSVVELKQSNPSPQRPLASVLEGAVPEPTQYELDFDWAEGKEPRPYYAKGQVEVVPIEAVQPIQGIPKARPLSPIEKQKLNNTMAKAKLGKRLTLAERRLLGKHELAKIMVRLRPRGGDYG